MAYGIGLNYPVGGELAVILHILVGLVVGFMPLPLLFYLKQSLYYTYTVACDSYLEHYCIVVFIFLLGICYFLPLY